MQALEPEATWVRRMRLSVSGQLRDLHAELTRATRVFERPTKLDQDRCLALVLKFCLFMTDKKSVSPKSLERSYQEFKDALPQRIRKEEQRSDLMLLCANIFHKREDIMSVDIEKDFLEKQGFSYSNTTFDDIFYKKWAGFATGFEDDSASSSEHDNEVSASGADGGSGGWGDELASVVGPAGAREPRADEAAQDAQDAGPAAEEESESAQAMDQQQFELLDPRKINQFKFLMDRYLQKPEDGGTSLLTTIDGYASLLSIILSNKRSEEIQEELITLVGFENIELCQQLIEKREIIQEQCKGIEEGLRKEKAQQDYRGKNFDVSRPGVGVSVEHVRVRGRGRHGKPVNVNANQKQNVSNYDLLEKLGFSQKLVGENKQLGLRERNMNDLNAYMLQHAQEMAQGATILRDEGANKAQVYKEMTGQTKSEIRAEENDDWKFVEITPPPKPPLDKTKLIRIDELPPFAREAFGSASHLNRIQTIVHPAAFKQSRNLLVAAPTGAGKTNIALLTILREVSLLVPEAATQTDQSTWSMKDKQFKIIYIAPLKALASEVVDKF